MPLTPYPISWTSANNFSNRVKPDALAADPDVVLVAPSTLPVDVQAQLILQDMGGTELIMFARHDTVDGQKILYQPIKDLDLLASEFNPKLITGYAPTYMTLKKGFIGDIDDTVPAIDPGSTGALAINTEAAGNGTEIIINVNTTSNTSVVELAMSLPEEKDLFPAPTPPIKGGEVKGNFGGFIVGGDSLGYNIDITVNGGGA